MNPDFPTHLPPLPPVPSGFDRWVYRGIKYPSPHAIMVTSFDETMDTEWDPPEFFQTVGDDHTHYAQAVIDHHHICECEACTHSSPAPDSTLIVCADSETQKTVMDRLRPSDTAMKAKSSSTFDRLKMQNFKTAFSSETGGCRRTCFCGKEFYDSGSGGYDWEDGELEELESSDAIALFHSVGDLDFQGRSYVDSCDCWHEQAQGMMRFVDSHARKIALYLTLEKQRKQLEADISPTVD